MWWKNQPPSLATTPHVIFVDCDLVAIIYWQSFLSIPITLAYRIIHTTLSCCVVPFCHPIFITNWCATWGSKLDSKDVQGRVGMKMEANMVQSLPMETPNISFQTCETYFWIHFVVYMFILFTSINLRALFQDLWSSIIKFPLFYFSL
jgi:hypothetical protein